MRYRYLAIISVLFSLILIFISLYLDSRNSNYTINIPILLSSVGCSIIASTIFALIYKSKTDDYLENRLTEDTRNNITDVLEKLFMENRLLSSEYPTKIFPASPEPNPEFNKLIDTNISKATFYRFNGARALYLSYRLKERIKITTPSLKIEIMLFNMENTEELRFRSKVMKTTDEYVNMSIEEIMQKMMYEQLAVLVAFYDIRQQHDFEIFFSDEISPFRYEIMDELLIISASSARKGNKFPAAFIYFKGSVFYNSYISHFEVQKYSTNSEKITSQTISPEIIINLANKYKLPPVNIEELRNFYVSKYQKYK